MFQETIVNRVLQTIMNNAKPQDIPFEQSACINDKVLNWDTSGGSGHLESRTPAPLSPSRSRSREFYRHQSQKSRSPPPRHRPERNYRRRSVSRSPERRYQSPRLRDSPRDRFLSPPRLSFLYRSRSRSRSLSRSRDRDRMNVRVSRRDISPRTRRYEYPGSPVPRHSSPRRSGSRRELDYRSPRRLEDERRRRSYDSSRKAETHHKRRSPRGTCTRYPERSPRSRKIVLLSPKKEGKHKDTYGEERGQGRSGIRSRSPVKRRVKDRLGVRNESIAEVFNMDNQRGNTCNFQLSCYGCVSLSTFRKVWCSGNHQGVH